MLFINVSWESKNNNNNNQKKKKNRKGRKLKAPSETPFQLFRKLKSQPLCFSVLDYSFLLPRHGGAAR